MSKRFFFSQLLITLFALLLLESVARFASTFIGDGKAKEINWFHYSADLGWDRQPNFSGLDLCGKHRAFDPRGLITIDSAELANNVGKHTALFVGDSITYGFCVDTQSTFVEVANRLLPEIRMINIGVPGYSSFQGYKSLVKYGDLIKPDVLFISFNWNDRRSARDATHLDNDATFRELAERSTTQNFLENIYLFRAARFIGKRLGLVRIEARTTVSLDSLRVRIDRPSYKENLIKMVEWARHHGSVPVFILFGDSPFHSALVRHGIRYLLEKNYAAAIKYLTLADERPRSELSALARLYLLKAYQELGRLDKAEQLRWIEPFFAGTVNDGGKPLLLDTDYNSIMIEVSHEYDVKLIDAKSELEKVPRVFFDDCHFDGEGHEIVAKLVENILKGLQWTGGRKEFR